MMAWTAWVNPAASAELVRIVRWYKRKGGTFVGNRFYNSWIDTINAIAVNPLACSPHDHDTRVVKFKNKFPYLIIFTVDPPNFRVVGIQYDAMQPRWHGRVKKNKRR